MRIERTDIRTTKLTTKRVKKAPAPKHDGFSVAFKRAVADGHANFFESRGMPVPVASNYISYSTKGASL